MSKPAPLDRLALALATLGPVGNMPKAPGTWASAAAVLAAPFLFLPLAPAWRVAALAALFAAGAWAASRAERALGKTDPGCVVIDELLGMWIALAPFNFLRWWQILFALALFRILDIAKPWPIRRLEKSLPGGLGVMADDALAGLIAAGGVWLLRWATWPTGPTTLPF
ncbi:MAG: phosphatidylglycerophosphatase A [Thermodesulfobacteriota bacterium]